MEKTGTTKAWMASAMTMMAVVLACLVVGQMPVTDTIQAALMDLIMVGASGLVSYIMTWLVTNKKI